MTVALKGEDVGRDAVEEEAIMAMMTAQWEVLQRRSLRIVRPQPILNGRRGSQANVCCYAARNLPFKQLRRRYDRRT